MASRKSVPRSPRTAGGKTSRPARPPALLGQLSELLRQLQQAQSAVMVSVAALRSQACEMDEDIALVLQRGVAERLNEQVDRLEAALRLLARGAPLGKL